MPVRIDSGEGLLGPIILSSHPALPLKISPVKLKSLGLQLPCLSPRTLSRRQRPVSARCHREEDCSQRVLDMVALSLGAIKQQRLTLGLCSLICVNGTQEFLSALQ